MLILIWYWLICGFFFQAEDGIRDLVRSRGLGDVYKRQIQIIKTFLLHLRKLLVRKLTEMFYMVTIQQNIYYCLLYTSDAADERSSVDLGGRRIIKKKTIQTIRGRHEIHKKYNDICKTSNKKIKS